MSILIITEECDSSVNSVMDWIFSYGENVIRLSVRDFFSHFMVSKSLPGDFLIRIRDEKSSFEIKSIWFRMDTSNDYMRFLFPEEFSMTHFLELRKYLYKEVVSAKQIFFNENKIRCLSNYNAINLNKVEVLFSAQKIGLTVPKTIVTNNRKDVMDFYREISDEKIICKSIGENLSLYTSDEFHLYQPILELGEKEIGTLPEIFFPSMFQELIQKEYDLRIVYLDGMCYSTSIHSGLLDFREDYEQLSYNTVKLPRDISLKIDNLMKRFSLNFGCIDLLKRFDSEDLVFLEINPSGQFGVFSAHSNFNMDKIIANYLCYGKQEG